MPARPTAILAVPSNDVPPIVLAVANAVAVAANVAVAAFPVVDWFSVPTVKSIVLSASTYATVMPLSVLEVTIAPTVSAITSLKSMFAVPSNDTPWIVRAVANAVAVPARATAILAVPSNDVPPIVLAVANAVAVAALPVVS